MSDKRRGAFLKALEVCGNQTLAAERVCVSRSWVCQERMRNPEFDSECRRVIEAARERLRAAEGNRPPEGWGHLDGVELVVRGTKGRRVQIARARAGQWTAASEDRFLEVFAATCNARAAYEAAGKSKGSAYTHRKRWPGFARRWEEAEEMASVRLEWALVERAANPFSSIELPPLIPVPAMRADDIMHNLYMHQHRTHGLGKAPGRAPRDPSRDEALGALDRAIGAVERARRLSEADKALDRRAWASRRRPRGVATHGRNGRDISGEAVALGSSGGDTGGCGRGEPGGTKRCVPRASVDHLGPPENGNGRLSGYLEAEPGKAGP
jgi:hypothetical protein